MLRLFFGFVALSCLPACEDGSGAQSRTASDEGAVAPPGADAAALVGAERASDVVADERDVDGGAAEVTQPSVEPSSSEPPDTDPAAPAPSSEEDGVGGGASEVDGSAPFDGEPSDRPLPDAGGVLDPDVGSLSDAEVPLDAQVVEEVSEDAAVVACDESPCPRFDLPVVEACEGPDPDEIAIIDRCRQLGALMIDDARVEEEPDGWQPGEGATVIVTLSAPADGDAIDTPGVAAIVDSASRDFASVPWGFWALFSMLPGDSYETRLRVELAEDAPPGATVYVHLSPSVGYGEVTACDCPGLTVPEFVVALEVAP